jgi:hypothetical protein
VTLESRDTLDSLIRVILMMFPVLGVAGLSEDKPLAYFIGLLVGSVVVMDVIGKYVVYYVAWYG